MIILVHAISDACQLETLPGHYPITLCYLQLHSLKLTPIKKYDSHYLQNINVSF